MQEHALALWEPTLRRVIATGRPEQVEFWLTGEGNEGNEGNEGHRWHHTMLAADREPGGAVVGVLASTRDITELKVAEQALEQLHRAPRQHVLFFVDVDKFKSINDTCGHDRGDKALVQLAERLTSLARPPARHNDTVARLGGDEFVILCEGVSNLAHICDIGNRFSEPSRRSDVHGEEERPEPVPPQGRLNILPRAFTERRRGESDRGAQPVDEWRRRPADQPGELTGRLGQQTGQRVRLERDHELRGPLVQARSEQPRQAIGPRHRAVDDVAADDLGDRGGQVGEVPRGVT